jgi:hypothetical protein
VDIVSRRPKKLSPRVDFAPSEFRKMVFTHGLRLTWEQAVECPCKRSAADDLVVSGNNLIDILETAGEKGTTFENRQECPACHGRGYLYHSPQEIRAICTRVGETPDAWKEWGEWARGALFLSTLPEHITGFHDRITLLDSVLVYRETLRRTGGIDALRYPIKTRVLDTGSVEDPTESDPISVDVLYAIKADADGAVDAETSVLTKVTDYTVTEDGKIKWIAEGNPPDVGSFFSISYYAAPRFVVVDIPHAFRDTWIGTKTALPYFASLPVNAMCRLEYLVSRGDA